MYLLQLRHLLGDAGLLTLDAIHITLQTIDHLFTLAHQALQLHLLRLLPLHQCQLLIQIFDLLFVCLALLDLFSCVLVLQADTK